MENEETRLINDPKQAVDPVIITKSVPSPQPTSANKKSGIAGKAAAAAGGFVGGAAAGMAMNAAAANTDENLSDESAMAEENPVTPEAEDVLLATDEGVRYAHVDADNFNDAFAQARAQVGPGGVFEYNGRLYGTYYADEWQNMSADERAAYQTRVTGSIPADHHSELADNNAATHHHVEAQPIAEEPLPANAELIAEEPVDNEIRVLGVEEVTTPDGDVMNVALVESGEQQALLVDVDNNGVIDVMLVDVNGNQQIDEGEVMDMSEAGLEVADLAEAQAAAEGDLLYAANDDMPDYVNDADSVMMMA